MSSLRTSGTREAATRRRTFSSWRRNSARSGSSEKIRSDARTPPISVRTRDTARASLVA
jgi:hypothetical protein